MSRVEYAWTISSGVRQRSADEHDEGDLGEVGGDGVGFADAVVLEVDAAVARGGEAAEAVAVGAPGADRVTVGRRGRGAVVAADQTSSLHVLAEAAELVRRARVVEGPVRA